MVASADLFGKSRRSLRGYLALSLSAASNEHCCRHAKYATCYSFTSKYSDCLALMSLIVADRLHKVRNAGWVLSTPMQWWELKATD